MTPAECGDIVEDAVRNAVSAAIENTTTLWTPALVGALIGAFVAISAYIGNRRNAADEDAREVHRAVTTGPGGEARAAMSNAEYRWWQCKQSVESQDARSENQGAQKFRSEWFHSTPGRKLVGRNSTMSMTMLEPMPAEQGLSLNQQFYVVAASLDQLAVTLRRYSRLTLSFGRSKRYRRLLGWHAGIHIAWVIWYIGAHSGADGTVPRRFDGAWGRVQDALDDIGEYKIHRRNFDDKTVKDFVRSELNEWVRPVLDNGNCKHGQTIAEAKAVCTLAASLGFALDTCEGPSVDSRSKSGPTDLVAGRAD